MYPNQKGLSLFSYVVRFCFDGRSVTGLIALAQIKLVLQVWRVYVIEAGRYKMAAGPSTQ